MTDAMRVDRPPGIGTEASSSLRTESKSNQIPRSDKTKAGDVNRENAKQEIFLKALGRHLQGKTNAG